MNLYDISISPMIRILGQMPRWLDKAQAHAEQKKFDPQVLLSARLSPDQWHLARQFQFVTVAPQRLSAFIKGGEAPKPDDGPTTLADLRTRLDTALESLKGLKPEDVQGAEDRVVPLPFMPGKGMKLTDFVIQFSLPNFFFHATTAYAILRHNGVDVGKMDFLGELTLRDL